MAATDSVNESCVSLMARRRGARDEYGVQGIFNHIDRTGLVMHSNAIGNAQCWSWHECAHAGAKRQCVLKNYRVDVGADNRLMGSRFLDPELVSNTG